MTSGEFEAILEKHEVEAIEEAPHNKITLMLDDDSEINLNLNLSWARSWYEDYINDQ